jgi:hypothetical protein
MFLFAPDTEEEQKSATPWSVWEPHRTDPARNLDVLVARFVHERDALAFIDGRAA